MATEMGGFAGKVLRVDLSTGKISFEDTVAKYREVLGGTGIGVPCNGRTAVTTLFPSCRSLVASGHMERPYAAFLAERADTGLLLNP
jgi:aldehyde:ferredoxin oxidoreductase